MKKIMDIVMTASPHVPELFYFDVDFYTLLASLGSTEGLYAGDIYTYDSSCGVPFNLNYVFPIKKHASLGYQTYLIGGEKIYSFLAGNSDYALEYDLTTGIIRSVSDYSTIVINRPYVILRVYLDTQMRFRYGLFDGDGSTQEMTQIITLPAAVLTNDNKVQFIADIQSYLDKILLPSSVYNILGSKFTNKHADYVVGNPQADALDLAADSVSIKTSIDALITSVSGVQNVMSEILVQLGTNNNLLTQINNKVG